MRTLGDIKRSIAAMRVRTRPETDKRILTDASATLESPGELPVDVTPVPSPPRFHSRGTLVLLFVAVLVFVVLFQVLRPRPMTLAKVYENLADAPRFHVSFFGPNRTEPYRQVWYSSALGVRLSRDTERVRVRYVLWDEPNRAVRTRDGQNVSTSPLTNDVLLRFVESLTERYGFVPFADAEAIPKGGRWLRVTDESVVGLVPAAAVFDFVYSSTGPDDSRWRLFIDRRTQLPLRSEHYRRITGADAYRLTAYSLVGYPTDAEIQAVIRDAFAMAGAGSPNP